MPIVKLYMKRTDAKLYRPNINKVEAEVEAVVDVDMDAMTKMMDGLVNATGDVAGRLVMVVVEDGTSIGSLKSNLIVSTKLDINNSYVIALHEVKFKPTISELNPHLLQIYPLLHHLHFLSIYLPLDMFLSKIPIAPCYCQMMG